MRRPTRFYNVFAWSLGLGLVGVVLGTLVQMSYMSARSSDPPLMGLLLSGPLSAVIGAIFGWFKPLKSRYEE